MLSRYINISVSVIAHTETHRLKDRQTHTYSKYKCQQICCMFQVYGSSTNFCTPK